MWHFLEHTGLSLKKTYVPVNRTALMSRGRRRQWQERQGKVCAARLIFIDETWAKMNMTRNLSSHKDTAIRRAIRAGGAKLFHRPKVPT